MALMTKQQYQDSIRARKPMNVWFLGEKIEDLTTYPPLAASFNAISKIYELQHNKAMKFYHLSTSNMPKMVMDLLFSNNHHIFFQFLVLLYLRMTFMFSFHFLEVWCELFTMNNSSLLFMFLIFY